MKLKELIKRLEVLKSKEFVETSRKGPTGIGHLLEKELGLSETNIAIPDIGGRVELKGTRRNANSLITLFTFNKSVWLIKQKELINKYGYTGHTSLALRRAARTARRRAARPRLRRHRRHAVGDCAARCAGTDPLQR